MVQIGRVKDVRPLLGGVLCASDLAIKSMADASNFLGSEIPCPSQPEAFLRTVYGDFQTVELTYVDKTAAKIRADIN